MKQYQNNLQQEEDQVSQYLIQKHQIENFLKESQEELPHNEFHKSYRLNQIRDKKQNSIKQQLDALSTATSNFYKEQNDNQIKIPTQLIDSYKKIDQSQIILIKQQRKANRIISAQPLRHLAIKKGQDSTQFQQFDKKEFKRPLLIFKGLGDKHLEQEDKEIINQQNISDQNQQIFKRASVLRKKSQSNGFYIVQNFQKQEQFRDSELIEGEKIYQDELIDSLEIETIQNITKMRESEFDQITRIQFRFNAKEGSLYMLGELLTNLQELTLDDSNIESFRLLGTKLTFLQKLSIKKSNLVDLSGILSMPNLVDLNCSFNNINDVSPLAFHSKIAILNLEGNQLIDEYQLDHLESLDLKYLNIKKNPLCQNQKLYEIFCQRFALIKIEIEAIPTIIESTNNELTLTQKIEFKEQKINQEEQKIKQFQNLVNDIEQNQSLCQSMEGKKHEKHKLRRPQTAKIQQVRLASPFQDQDFDPYNQVIEEKLKDTQNKQIYSSIKHNF